MEEQSVFNGRTVPVTQEQVRKAYTKVKQSKGIGGVDKLNFDDLEQNLDNHLYKLWNRLSSGSYMPSAVLAREIPKLDGTRRKLGIPTILDRVAQQVVKVLLEPKLEGVFHAHSYGYRPYKDAHQAIDRCREQCFGKSWVIDLDIKGYFDNIPHDKMLQCLMHLNTPKWMMMYIERWLQAPMQEADGSLTKRNSGTPQGGVISPLLANLYLHYSFDKWMELKYPSITFERYADDIIVHCQAEEQARNLLTQITQRLAACGLTLHPEKTKIVNCKSKGKQDETHATAFTFLGYTYCRRRVMTRYGIREGFTPAISTKAEKNIVRKFNSLVQKIPTHTSLNEFAITANRAIKGWMNYYGHQTKSALSKVCRAINSRISIWIMKKLKKVKSRLQARTKLKEIYANLPKLFAHWAYGFKLN